MQRTSLRTALLALSLLAAAAPAHAGKEKDYPRRFGKTNEQILSMGYQRWMDWQGAKAGQSTAGMNEGMAAYRTALRSRNDRLVRTAPPKLRSQVAALRPLLERFTTSTVEIGSFITGGGTLWSLVHSDSMVDVETTLHSLLTGKGPRPKPHTTGQVLRALQRLEPAIADAAKDRPEAKEEHRDALKALEQARSDFRTLSAIAAGLDRRRSDQVLSHCVQQVQTAIENFGPD